MNLSDLTSAAGAPQTKPWLTAVTYSLETVDVKADTADFDDVKASVAEFDTLTVAGSPIGNVAASDNNAAQVWGLGARSVWAASSAPAALDGINQFYIDVGPAAGRQVACSSNTGNLGGVYYTNDGGVNWVAATGVVLQEGTLAYDGVRVFFINPDDGAVYRSSDYGATFSLVSAAGALGVGFRRVEWVPWLSLFVGAWGLGGITVATSPDCVNWTARASATRNVRWRFLVTPTNIIALGTGGVMTSVDGITWVNGIATSMLSGAYSPELDLCVAGDTTVGSTLYTSQDRGLTWSTRLNVKPEAQPYRAMLWASNVGAFVFANIAVGTGANSVYTWDGSALTSLVGGQPQGLVFGGGGTEIYGLNYNPKYRALFASYNTPITPFWQCRDGGAGVSLQPAQNLGVSGAAISTGLYLRPQTLGAAVGPAGAAGQIYVSSATGATLLYVAAGVQYPIAGPAARRSIRFDASLSQLIWPSDGVLSISWNGVSRQATFSLALATFSGSTNASSTSSSQNGVFQISVGTNSALVAAATYFVSSCTAVADATQNLTSPTPQSALQTLFPGTGTTAGTPYYTVQVVVSATAIGNITIARKYSI